MKTDNFSLSVNHLKIQFKLYAGRKTPNSENFIADYCCKPGGAECQEGLSSSTSSLTRNRLQPPLPQVHGLTSPRPNDSTALLAPRRASTLQRSRGEPGTASQGRIWAQCPVGAWTLGSLPLLQCSAPAPGAPHKAVRWDVGCGDLSSQWPARLEGPAPCRPCSPDRLSAGLPALRGAQGGLVGPKGEDFIIPAVFFV